MSTQEEARPVWLEQALSEAPIADDGFTRATMQRVDRFRRRKRRVFSLAVGGTVGMVAALLGASDLSWAAGPLADPATIASGLLLSALFGLCWISTDSPLAVFDRV